MKEKVKYLKILLKELYDFKPRIYLSLFLYIIIEAVFPLLQLLLSAFVIQWLMEGIAIQDYLVRLLLMIVGVGAASLGQTYFMLLLEENQNTFRSYMQTKIAKKYLALDYPLLIGKEAQERYNSANELTWNNMTLFGRLPLEIIEFGSSLVGLFLYIRILGQLESFFFLFVGGFIILVAIFKYLQVKLDRKIFQEKAANTQKRRYLRKIYGESRITKDVRLYQMREWLERIEETIIDNYHTILKPKVQLDWTESTVINIGIVVLAGLSYFRSVQLIVAGVIPVSSFVVYAGSVTLLAQTIIQFVTAIGNMTVSLNETKQYDRFMSQEQVFNHQAGEMTPKTPIEIELRDVTYTYPNSDEPTIKSVSFTIQPNEKLAVVGENGAGKSTLINLITGLLIPDSGEILINGISQKDFNIGDYYDLFAPVFQEKYLLTYSIKDTIIQGLPYEIEKYERILELSGVEQIIARFSKGDDTKIVRSVYSDGVTLSGGQLQKVKLAQALYKDAPILLLDEPTAALDPIAEHQIYQDYFKFSKDKMSIFISHRLSSTRFCDRILYIKNGEISEEGTHEELMADQKDYYRLYEAQAHYYRESEDEVVEEKVLTGGVV